VRDLNDSTLPASILLCVSFAPKRKKEVKL
jgi:hypothetical protein